MHCCHYSSIRSYEVIVKILNDITLRDIQYKYIIKDFRTALLQKLTIILDVIKGQVHRAINKIITTRVMYDRTIDVRSYFL